MVPYYGESWLVTKQPFQAGPDSWAIGLPGGGGGGALWYLGGAYARYQNLTIPLKH